MCCASASAFAHECVSHTTGAGRKLFSISFLSTIKCSKFISNCMRNRPLMPPSRLALRCDARTTCQLSIFFNFYSRLASAAASEHFIRNSVQAFAFFCSVIHVVSFAEDIHTVVTSGWLAGWLAGWLTDTHTAQCTWVHCRFVGTRAVVVIDISDNWYEMLNSNATVSSNLPSAELSLPSPSPNGISYAQKIHSTDGFSISDSHSPTHSHERGKKANKQPSDRLNISSTWVLVWNS